MFKPLLAPRECPLSYPRFFEELRFPLLASPKFDGIRCIVRGGVCYSRTMKPLRSRQVQELFGEFEGLDGELIVGDPTAFNVYNTTSSCVMSFDKPGDVRFFAFDTTVSDMLSQPFSERLDFAAYMVKGVSAPVVHVGHKLIEDLEQLFFYEHECLSAGYEGVMMRDPDGPYKCNRATFREGIIYKLKRFQDDEGILVDFVEQNTNMNEAKLDERGYTKRSAARDGLVAAGAVGCLLVDFRGELIEVAPGALTHRQRKEMFERFDEFKGRLVTFRHFAHGVKDKPRFPRFVGFRDLTDL